MSLNSAIVESLDQQIRASLQSLVDHYFWWLIASTVLVVLGVVLEAPEVWYEFSEWRAQRRGQTLSPAKGGARIFLSSIGLLLVIVGVMGEGISESLSSQAEGELRVFDEILVSATQAETARVNKRAANASRDAEVARRESSEADERTAQLEKAATEQGMRAALLERQAAELRQENLATETRLNKANQDLEKERIQRLAMEDALAPRELPLIVGGGHANFGSLLQFHQLSVIIEYVPDAEAQRAAQEIETFLEAAHWHINSISSNSRLNQGFYDGVFIQYYSGRYYTDKQVKYRDLKSSMLCRQAADAFSTVLHEYDWEARVDPGGDDYDLAPNTVKINVGMKPNSFPTRASKNWELERNRWLKEHGLQISQPQP